ncbi:MAG: hypothetical protein KAX49_04855 [Halanaerobiales bacterium]|nr:hypothetical protein [Halanaerobiales bacterium]
MRNVSDNKVKGEFIEKFSQEEFDFIISLLPHSKLVEPIKKHNKEFRKEIIGYRPDSLSNKKLQNITIKEFIRKKIIFYVIIYTF